MKTILWFVVGLAEAVIFVFAIGLLSIQESGALSGAVYDLNNVVVAVTSPSLPALQYVAIAALSLVTVYFVTLGKATLIRSARLALATGLSVGLSLFIVWALALRATLISDTGREQGIPAGWNGWVLLGGSNSVVHLVLLLAVTALVLDLRHRDSPTETESQQPENSTRPEDRAGKPRRF
jgi:hypothetical protein